MNKEKMVVAVGAAKILVPVGLLGTLGTVVYMKRNDIKAWWVKITEQFKRMLQNLNPFSKIKAKTDEIAKKSNEFFEKKKEAVQSLVKEVSKQAPAYINQAKNTVARIQEGASQSVQNAVKQMAALREADRRISRKIINQALVDAKRVRHALKLGMSRLKLRR